MNPASNPNRHPWDSAATCMAVLVLIVIFCVFHGNTKEPQKPEIEMSITHTNVNATVVTWTKTKNGRQVVWGYVEIGGRIVPLIPYTK